VALATALSCFFGLVANSLRGFRRSAMSEEIAGDGRRQRLENVERDLLPLQLTASLCRAVVHLVLVTSLVYLYSDPDHARAWGGAFGAVATAAGVIAVFGVGIPSAWSRAAGMQVVAATYGVMMALRYALWPVVFVMLAFETPVRRLAGLRDTEEHDQARQEILQAATEGAAEGKVEHEEVQMIASVIGFADRRAGEVMTPRTDVFALPVETTWAAACKAVYEGGQSRVPVYQDDLDNIIGVLYAKDLLHYVEQDKPPILRAIMRKAFFVPETKPLDDLLREFRARKVHMAVVLDEYGGTAGVVSIEDVLEEIVGDISDEYDRAEPALMHRLDELSAEVDGRMYIDDLNAAMKLDVPENQDYVTVAGMVFSELGYIPHAGETLESHGARFTVLAADERKITKLKVEKLPAQTGEEEAEE
jgi:putative hemolysin